VKKLLLLAATMLCLMGGQASFADIVDIELPVHHLGDGSGNEGTVFEKTFLLNSISVNSTLEFDFVRWGPNLESPPEVFLNNQSVGPLGPQFPPLDLSDPKWQTNPDGSHDYNGGFHVSFPATHLLLEGSNVFRIQNGRPDDDYFFENVRIIPEPTSVALIGMFTFGIYFVRRFFAV
jgi:hypothetical protein